MIVGKITHWKLFKKCKLEVKDKWYKHEPEVVLVNEGYKVLWDFIIQIGHQM